MTTERSTDKAAKGILLVGFDYANAQSDEFHDWYDLEHIPEREAVAGFHACRRWLNPDKPEAVATYDLDSVQVLDSDAYRAIAGDNLSPWSKRVTSQCRRLIRFEGDLIGDDAANPPANPGGLLVNAMNVAPEHEDEFNAWYDEEHLPALRSVPGTLTAYRYRGRDTGTHRYIAVYYLEDPAVTRSDAWRTAANTAWTEKVRPHFKDHVRVLAGAYQRAS